LWTYPCGRFADGAATHQDLRDNHNFTQAYMAKEFKANNFKTTQEKFARHTSYCRFNGLQCQ
jgi:hypothetical protein